MSEDNTQPSETVTMQPAKESRSNAANYSEALTKYAAGYKDPSNLEALLDFIAPSVKVGRRFEFKRASNAEAFVSESDDVRAIGSAFKRVEYSGETVNERTYNKGLTIRVDHDEIADADWKERYIGLIMQRLRRNELRRAIAILDKAAKDKKITWDSKSNPDADLRKTLMEAADITGIRPNRVLFGERAWDERCTAFESKENVAAFRSADLPPAQLASKLLVDNVEIMRARYQAGKDKAALIGNNVYAYYAQNDIAKDEPSNIKRFVSSSSEIGDFRVFEEVHAKYTDITVEHYSNIVVTSDIGIQKISIN